MIRTRRLTTKLGIPPAGLPSRARILKARRDRALPVRVVPLLLLALLAPLAMWWMSRNDDAPHSLREARLTGIRQVQGPVCLALVSDVSGSMQQLAPVRDAALQSLFDFSRRELDLDDVLLTVAFDDQAALTMPPTKVAVVGQTFVHPGSLGGHGTRLAPAVDLAGTSLGSVTCAASAVAIVSDGLLQDPPALLAEQLRTAGLGRVAVLVPDGHGRPGPLSEPELNGVEVNTFSADDPARLGLLYGALLSKLTGQRLSR
jgi:hypothetical protein